MPINCKKIVKIYGKPITNRLNNIPLLLCCLNSWKLFKVYSTQSGHILINLYYQFIISITFRALIKIKAIGTNN